MSAKILYHYVTLVTLWPWRILQFKLQATLAFCLMLNTFPYSAFTLGRKSLDMSSHLSSDKSPSVDGSIEKCVHILRRMSLDKLLHMWLVWLTLPLNNVASNVFSRMWSNLSSDMRFSVKALLCAIIPETVSRGFVLKMFETTIVTFTFTQGNRYLCQFILAF